MPSDMTMFRMNRTDILVLLGVLEEFHTNVDIAHEDYSDCFIATSHELQTKLTDRYNLMVKPEEL